MCNMLLSKAYLNLSKLSWLEHRRWAIEAARFLVNVLAAYEKYRREVLSEERVYLSQVSPKDKPWDRHKANTEKVSKLYSQTELQRHAERTSKCAEVLGFGLVIDDNNSTNYKLENASFCRCRYCPNCQWRRSLMWKARFHRAFPKLRADYPKTHFILLTLTVRNCPITELRETVDWMNSAWQRLVQRKAFPAIGFLKSVEVTRNSQTNYAHPHFHVLLMVPANYFGGTGGYLSHEKWVKMWRSCLRADYDPQVDVRRVKPKKGSTDIESAIKETLKYGVKEDDLIADADWLEELSRQMHKTRAIAPGGVFKNYFAEEEPENLINDDQPDEQVEPMTSEKYYFNWDRKPNRYTYRKPSDTG